MPLAGLLPAQMDDRRNKKPSSIGWYHQLIKHAQRYVYSILGPSASSEHPNTLTGAGPDAILKSLYPYLGHGYDMAARTCS